MKTGRFRESIAQYEKALSIQANFVASWVGIGLDNVLLDQPVEARRSFERLGGVARTAGERRQALFWTAASYVHEGAHDKALETLERMRAAAEAQGALGDASGDLNQSANVLLEAGRVEQAERTFARGVEAMQRADVPEEVKAGARRNALYDQARVALARKDLGAAREKAAAYGREASARRIPFELRRRHELLGLVALQAGDAAAAVGELRQANQQDPRVLYQLGLALRAKGEPAEARRALERAANFNGLNFNHAYVRRKAREALTRS
jgi:tetratricopeptide (TPR) repeat protein